MSDRVAPQSIARPSEEPELPGSIYTAHPFVEIDDETSSTVVFYLSLLQDICESMDTYDGLTA